MCFFWVLHSWFLTWSKRVDSQFFLSLWFRIQEHKVMRKNNNSAKGVGCSEFESGAWKLRYKNRSVCGQTIEIIEIIWLPQEMFWGRFSNFSLIEGNCQLWLLLTCTNYVRVQVKLFPVTLCAQMSAKWPFWIAEQVRHIMFSWRVAISGKHDMSHLQLPAQHLETAIWYKKFQYCLLFTT